MFLFTIIYLIGFIISLTMISFIPIGIGISFIVTGEVGPYFELIMKYGYNMDNIIDNLKEKILK